MLLLSINPCPISLRQDIYLNNSIWSGLSLIFGSWIIQQYIHDLTLDKESLVTMEWSYY
jgi:hypothetical protein